MKILVGIWDSEVALTEFGWVVEMKIPYAALRFSKAENKLKLYAEIKRNVQNTWNQLILKLSGDSAGWYS
jgi:hypothetical protein